MGSKARIVASTAYIVSASIPIRSMQQGLRPCPACICFCSPSEQHPLSHCYQSQKFYATWNPPNRDDLMPPRLSHWGGGFFKGGWPSQDAAACNLCYLSKSIWAYHFEASRRHSAAH